MNQYWKSALLAIISVTALLSGCGLGVPPIPEDCRKAIRSHALVIQRMKASGRFADDLIKKHETQFMLLEALADMEKDQEKSLSAVVKPIRLLARNWNCQQIFPKSPNRNWKKVFGHL